MKQSTLKNLTNIGIFLALLAVIIEFFPHKQSKFQYHFEIGKPWGYELMTAEFDFPIYKTDEQLTAEREEVLRDYSPYFQLLQEVETRETAAILSQNATEKLSDKQRQQLKTRLETVFRQGILDAAELDRLRKDKTTAISIVVNQQATTQPIDKIYTPRQAYSYILDGTNNQEAALLRELDLNRYLVQNLKYDTLLSQRMYDNLINSISLTEGMVQQGEKIIDRGEIVTPNTYQVLQSLSKAYEEKEITLQHNIYSIGGQVVLLIYFLAMLALYLIVFRPTLYEHTRNIVFFCSLIGLVIILTCCVIRFTNVSIYILPYMWVPVLVRVFYDSRTALYTHMVTTLLLALIVPVPYEFMVLQVGAGMVAIGSIRTISQRSQIIQTSIIIVVAYAILYTALTLSTTGSLQSIDPWMYLYFFIAGLLVVGTYGMVYLIEKAFGFVSYITLVELTNINSALMLEFAEKAPGTFQHSMQVSNLATEAAKRIGANALLVRTGALYHDIGKLAHPENYTENQQSGYNPLLEMSFEQAAQAVISHVTEGVAIAKRNHLPNIIIECILTHHGTSKVRYFYNSWVNAHPDEKPDETLFTYPGPKPRSKETCILMMADAVEARSRSLQEFTPEGIREMVSQMIGAQMADGQFTESMLTLRDIEDIKQVFTEKIISMNHHRIAYPEINSEFRILN